MRGAGPWLALVAREWRLAWRGGGTGLALAFFVLVLVFLPLAVGAKAGWLAAAGPGLVWIAAVLAQLLTLERLFQADLESGTLDLYVGAHLPLRAIVLGKAAGHWFSVGLPLACVAPIGAGLLGLPAGALHVLLLSLLLGLPGLSLTGVLVAALTAGIRRGSLLLTLLTMPLYIPFLIFGAGAATLAANPAAALTPWPSLLLLAAATLIACLAVLLLGAQALRSQID